MTEDDSCQDLSQGSVLELRTATELVIFLVVLAPRLPSVLGEEGTKISDVKGYHPMQVSHGYTIL